MDPEHLSLPEIVPSVSFAIDFNKAVEYVDFDYIAFYSLMKKSGISDNEIESHNITFKLSKNNLIEGEYVPKRFYRLNNKSTIEVPSDYREEHAGDEVQLKVDVEDYIITAPGSMNDAINKVVRHETGHFVDFYRGISTRQYRVAQAMRFGQYAGLLNTAASFSYGTAEKSGLSATVGLCSALAVIGLCKVYLKRYGEHSQRPWEKTANEFESKHQDVTLVTLTPLAEQIREVPKISIVQKMSVQPRAEANHQTSA